MKGKTNNPNGRPKGAANKVTTELRGWVQKLLDDNREQLLRDFQALDPPDRWRVTEKLLQYIIPKMQSVEASVEISALSEAQIDEIINDLHSKIND